MDQKSPRASLHIKPQQQHQQLNSSLFRADQLLAALPDEYFPTGSHASSSTPRCRCHVDRLSQLAKQSPGAGSASISYSCSSLLSFADSTDASNEDWPNKPKEPENPTALAAKQQLNNIRREEAQLRRLLADLDERMSRLRRGQLGLLSLQRISVERLLAALAVKAKEAADKGEQQMRAAGDRKNCCSNSSDESGSCLSESDILEDLD